MKILFKVFIFTCIIFVGQAQNSFKDPIEKMPRGTVLTFDEEVIIAPKQTEVVLSNGVVLFVKSSDVERKISKGRSFTIKETKFKGFNKGEDVAAELWFYASFIDDNIDFLEVYVGDRAVKGQVAWNVKTIGDIEELELISLVLPDIQEF